MTRTKKQPDFAAKRGRRRNDEILKVSTPVIAIMRGLAKESGMPLNRVFADVIDIGLCETRRILYDQIIAARREIQARLSDDKIRTTDEGSGSGGTSPDLRIRSAEYAAVESVAERAAEATSTDSAGSDHAPVFPGFGAEDAEDSVMAAGQDQSDAGPDPRPGVEH